MPWPARIALGWFILLTIGACMTLLALQGMWVGVGEMGLGWMLRMQVVCIGYVALGVGFVAALPSSAMTARQRSSGGIP